MCPSSADSGTFLTLIRTVSGLNLRISRILRVQSNLPTTQSSLDLDLLFMLSESLGLFVPLYTQLEYRYMMVWFIIYIVYSGISHFSRCCLQFRRLVLCSIPLICWIIILINSWYGGRRERIVVGFTTTEGISFITTKVVSSNPVHGEMYSIQH